MLNLQASKIKLNVLNVSNTNDNDNKNDVNNNNELNKKKNSNKEHENNHGKHIRGEAEYRKALNDMLLLQFHQFPDAGGSLFHRKSNKSTASNRRYSV